MVTSRGVSVHSNIWYYLFDTDAVDAKRVVNEGLRALDADDKWVNNVSDDGRYEGTSMSTSIQSSESGKRPNC